MVQSVLKLSSSAFRAPSTILEGDKEKAMSVKHRYRLLVSLCETSKDYGLSSIKHLSQT